MEPTMMFERAAAGAVAMVAGVRAGQWHASTPCTEWDVRQLVDHMHGGPAYLLSALGAGPPVESDEESYRAAVSSCLEALREPGALEHCCMSPAGFEWTVAEAATGQDRSLDAEVVDAVVATFLPDMPEVGRAAGIVGPAVAVPADASAQDRLLGAMGRHP